MTRLISAMALFLMTTGLSAENIAGEEAAIRKLWERFEEAYDSNDANKVASLYSPDSDRINADMRVRRLQGG